MFWLNHECSQFWIDWNHLEHPAEISNLLLEHTTAHLVLLDEDADAMEYRESFDNKSTRKRLTVANYSVSTDDSLRKHFSEIYRVFDDVFISGSSSRIAVANESAVGTILITDSADVQDAMVGPDAMINEREFEDLAKNLFYGGILGEVALFPNKALLPGHSADKSLEVIPYRFTTDFDQIPVAYALGRYLRKEDDLQRRHHFTRLIKKAKYRPELFADRIGRLIAAMLSNYILQVEGVGRALVTFVPKKPSDPFDRNEILLQKLPALLKQKKLPFELIELLDCPQDFQKQKELGTYAQKRQNVEGKYRVTEDVEGKDIVLFDDVYTSGNTLAECARVLIEAGATRVIPICVGLTCHECPSAVPPLTCKVCGSALHVSFRDSDGGAFWGCPNWNDGKKHPVVTFSEGIKTIRETQSKIDDENFPF